MPGASLIDFLNRIAIITPGSSFFEILTGYVGMIESIFAMDGGQSTVENDSAPEAARVGTFYVPTRYGAFHVQSRGQNNERFARPTECSQLDYPIADSRLRPKRVD